MKMEAGQQPLDRFMDEADLKNNDLVKCSKEGLTHKQVSKARKGRRITQRMQKKILCAWNDLTGEKREMNELFNYRGQ
ncbi:MAG: hypothetical protein HN584_04610 [Akkermansiaceae bacterium]|jgi:hypothetical protein|nr:hypothetical protein [Akkermansiaceae bacterium]